MKNEINNPDFYRDYYPLLEKEIKYIYEYLFGEKCINLEDFFHPENNLNTKKYSDFHESFLKYLRWDINQCSLGKNDSAYKFCQDMIRDVRDQFREIVNFHGLTDSSFLSYQTEWHRQFLKICVGPPYMRLMQLEALIESNICDIRIAYNPKLIENDNKFKLVSTYGNDEVGVEVEYIVEAITTSHMLYESKLHSNLKRRFREFSILNKGWGSLEVNKDFNIFNKTGSINKDFYAFGIPTEGSKYFTQVLGRPNMKSTFLIESNKLALNLIESI